MAAQKKQAQVNLLPQEEFAGTTFGRTLRWAMGSFRIIVIATEMIVMLAFLSRFWLDARNADLNDLIKQKAAVLSASADFEKEFKDTQKKLTIFDALAVEEGAPSSLLGTITTLMPTDILLLSYAFSGEAIQIRGTSQNEISIAQFMVNLENSESFDKVTLNNLDTGDDGQFTFTLRLIARKAS